MRHYVIPPVCTPLSRLRSEWGKPSSPCPPLVKAYIRAMFGLRALVLAALAAYLLLALSVRTAQHMDWAPEGSLLELVVARVTPDSTG